jgi:sensor domain CHASE-containing protein
MMPMDTNESILEEMKKKEKERQIMKCAACHHEMVEKTGEIDLRIGGRHFLVRDVSYEEEINSKPTLDSW